MDAIAAPLMTLGDICREVNERHHRVKYAIESYRIEPVQRAGIIRLWSRDQLPHIKSCLARTAGRREVAYA